MMKLFEKNVGKLDRIVRIIVGVAILVSGAMFLRAPLMYLAMLVSIIFMFTGVAGTCALYSLIGLNTGAEPAAKEGKIPSASAPPSPKRKKSKQ